MKTVGLLMLCMVAGWLIAVVALVAAIEITDGKAIDSAWLTS